MTWGVVILQHPFVCNVCSHANVAFSEPFKDILIKNLAVGLDASCGIDRRTQIILSKWRRELVKYGYQENTSETRSFR